MISLRGKNISESRQKFRVGVSRCWLFIHYKLKTKVAWKLLRTNNYKLTTLFSAAQ